MDASLATIGIIVAFVIGFILGRKSHSDQDNKSNGGKSGPPTRYESTIKSNFAVDGPNQYSIKNVSDLNWYDSCVLVLKDEFTMERARVYGIGRKRWEKIKRLWLTNDLLTEYADRTVHAPTREARDKIRGILVQSNRRIDWRAIHRNTFVPPVQLSKLNPAEGWIPLNLPR